MSKEVTMSKEGGEKESGIVETLRGNKSFRELFAEEREKRSANADFCSILVKLEEILINKGEKFDKAAKVQETTIPQIFDGHHIMARAQTGAGKTYAFAIGMIGKINRSNKNVQAVCFAPTQELVKQIKKEIDSLVKGMDPEIRVVDTSVASDIDWSSMTRDNLPHIIVSTSGGLSTRLGNLTRGLKSSWNDIKKSLLGNVKLLVLDEADDMITEFSSLLKEDLPKLKQFYGLNFEQVVCYSATYKPESINQIKAICKTNEGRNLKRLELPYAISPAIKQIIVKVKAENDKNLTQRRKLEALKDIFSHNVVQKSIIFMNNKHSNRYSPVSIDSTAPEIQSLSNPTAGIVYACGKFYAGLEDPSKPGSKDTHDLNSYRDKVFTNFCKSKGETGAFDVIITSDVLSRGIDLPEINLVINFDLPLKRDSSGKYIQGSADPITYIHRIGRCSRYGKIGTAITFVEDDAADNSGFEEIKSYCTSGLIAGVTCEFSYSEVAAGEGVGGRVRSLIEDFKSKAEDIIDEEKKEEFIVSDDSDASVNAGTTGISDSISTIFDASVNAGTTGISNAVESNPTIFDATVNASTTGISNAVDLNSTISDSAVTAVTTNMSNATIGDASTSK